MGDTHGSFKKESSVYHSLIQILAAARLLDRAQGATIGELAEQLGIDKRSVYRVLDALDELNYPYVKDDSREARYRLMDGQRASKWWMPLPSVAFELEDRIILDWLFDSVTRSSALAEKVRVLRKKLAFVGAATGMALEPKEGGAGSQKHARLLVETPVLAKSLPDGANAILETLLSATARNRVCEVSYEARETGVVKTYDIHPLAVFENEGGIYTFVLIPRYCSIRILALERIRELVQKAETFVAPKGFDADARLADPFGIVQGESVKVRLRFSEDQAPYVRDRAWPESYHFEEDDKGRLLMSFETGGIFGLKRWILSWGADAEVLEPIWFREKVKTELTAMSAIYV